MILEPTLDFNTAVLLWFEDHKKDIKPRTIEACRLYISKLRPAFSGKLLSQITAIDVLEYQQQQKRSGRYFGSINHEINLLKQVLECAELWHPIRRHYKQIKPPQWTPPKVLTPEDEQRFFKVAASRPQWRVAYLCSLIANNTTAIGQELLHLQLRHIFLDHNPPKIHINDERVKNEFRARVIPLNAIALDAISQLVERAKRLGACMPHHYVIPGAVSRNQFDVNKAPSRSYLRAQFVQIRKACGIDWFQHRNFRNMAITRLFEAGTPDETIASIAGHSSIRMSQFYSRIRVEAKADALDAIAAGKKVKLSKPAQRKAPDATGQHDLMRQVAALVKDTGIDVATAMQIVKGFAPEHASPARGKAYKAVAKVDAALGKMASAVKAGITILTPTKGGIAD